MEGFRGKVLVVSNECFNWGSSNGRTIMNLLDGIPTEQIAQFYIHGTPDPVFCKQYFCVSDRDALHALLPGKRRTAPSASASDRRTVARNCRNLYLRNAVWQSRMWWKKEFNAFLQSVSPDVVILQAGDAPFMYDIARRIANRFRVPLLIYNSEAYVLKETLYDGISTKDIWHRLLQKALKRAFLRGIRYAGCCVYNTEYIADKYRLAYPMEKDSLVLYTASALSPIREKETKDQFTLLYCGNMGVGRVAPLCQVADVLHALDKDAKMLVCGSIPTEQEKEMLCSKPNVEYGGRVPYGEVLRLMGQASMLLHCESSAMLRDLEYAFSTKIADNLASGRPFLVYASAEYPFVQYLNENGCAHIATSEASLKTVLARCIEDEGYRSQYKEAAVALAAQNHNLENNCKKFRAVLARLCNNREEA